MKTITLIDEQEWACDKYGYGVFSRRTDGTWQQHVGTGDAPRFKDSHVFSRYIHEHFYEQPKMKRGSANGW